MACVLLAQAEQVIEEDNVLEALDVIELYCKILIEHTAKLENPKYVQSAVQSLLVVVAPALSFRFPRLTWKDCRFGSFGGTQGMQRGDQGGGGGSDVRVRSVRRAAGAAGRAPHPCRQVRPGLRQGGQGGRPRRRRPHGSFNSFQLIRLAYRLSPQLHVTGVGAETGRCTVRLLQLVRKLSGERASLEQTRRLAKEIAAEKDILLEFPENPVQIHQGGRTASQTNSQSGREQANNAPGRTILEEESAVRTDRVQVCAVIALQDHHKSSILYLRYLVLRIDGV